MMQAAVPHQPARRQWGPAPCPLAWPNTRPARRHALRRSRPLGDTNLFTGPLFGPSQGTSSFVAAPRPGGSAPGGAGGAAAGLASFLPASASPTFNLASGVGGSAASAASAAGLLSGATGILGAVGSALPFVGAGLAAAGVGINLIKCGTIGTRGCVKRSQTKSQNGAVQLALQAAYQGHDLGNKTAAAQLLQQSGQQFQALAQQGWGNAPIGFGGYCSPGTLPVPATSTAAKILCGNCFTNCSAQSGTLHQTMTAQDFLNMVGDVINGPAGQQTPGGNAAAPGSAPAAAGTPVQPGSPIRLSAAGASAAAAAAAAPGAQKKSSLLPLAIGGALLALVLLA